MSNSVEKYIGLNSAAVMAASNAAVANAKYEKNRIEKTAGSDKGGRRHRNKTRKHRKSNRRSRKYRR